MNFAFALMLAVNASDSGVENARVFTTVPSLALCQMHADTLNASGQDTYAFCVDLRESDHE